MLKRAGDLLAAGLAMVLAAPVMLAASVAILATMSRPVLFRQRRAGRDGRPFDIVKFRTMRAPNDTGGDSDAARLTALGRWLRATSIDELPTLWNVLRGDMSLVGPRPLHLHYVPRYSAAQRRRLDVVPGLTGWAQVNGRNTLDWDSRFALDLWYVDHRTARLDLLILLKTVALVIKRDGISASGEATMPEFRPDA